MTSTSYMIEDFKELLKDYEYLKADNSWCRGEMALREELTEKYMSPKTIDVTWLYTTDRWFHDSINGYVKQWILENAMTCEDDEWETFSYKGRDYDINIHIPDDIDEPDYTDIRAVAYGVKFNGVSLSADMENECVLKDVMPSKRLMDSYNRGDNK